MEMSIQTQRRKKGELAPLNASVADVDEDEKEKQRKIKRLSLINRELIETLKRQNDQLTKKINKQKMKVGRSVERVESPTRNLEKEKKELANAYKQIQMYKAVLKDLKAKEISTESIEKLNQLDNKIKFEDANIDKLQKELKYIKNIKTQQEKELHLYENNDVKTSVNELEEELKQLKEKIKMSKRNAKKREDLAMKQHAYFMELEKTLRKHNNEYYPGMTVRPTQPGQEAIDPDEVTEREWQIIRAQLVELKRNHEENNKKIEQLTRQRNKEIKSTEENQDRFKEKQRKLNSIKTKMNELAKLVGGDDKKPMRPIQQEDSPKGKNSDSDRQVKKWMIPQGYVREKGKILPDSTFFSDKNQLNKTSKSKIIRVQVWCDSAQSPVLCQFHYALEDGREISGIVPYTPSELENLETRVIEFKEGDYLAKVSGKINEGFVSSLTFTSKFGKQASFNPSAHGEPFRFEGRPGELPTVMFGACVRDIQERLRLCYIGCEFIADW